MTEPVQLFDTPAYERISTDEAHMLVMLGATDIKFQFVVHESRFLQRHVFTATRYMVKMHQEGIAKGTHRVQYARKKA